MFIENLSYFITFVVTAGLTVIGIMVSYQFYHANKKPLLALLLYQQIFYFSFLTYSIWGNLALRLVISDLNLSSELLSKLAFYIPVIGVPFMVVSWFMLLRFSMSLNGYKSIKKLALFFFPILVMIVLIPGVLIQKGVIQIPEDADLFIVRILIVVNLVVTLVFILPFYKPKRNAPDLKETGFTKRWALLFFLAIVTSSVIMNFFDLFGFISICISIILLFASGIFIPLVIRMNHTLSESEKSMDFRSFCDFYEISKREAQIIQEICSGKSNKAIAEKLFISLQTVKDHNHRIFTKTGVSSRVQLSNLVRGKTGQ